MRPGHVRILACPKAGCIVKKSVGDPVEQHYSGDDNLIEAISACLASEGKTPGNLTAAELATIDEFHIRGRKATLELAGAMQLKAADHVLDIGCGLGGPARLLAQEFDCRVTGIDLTEDFCRAATVLSEWVGLNDRVSFQQADATALPFNQDQFDAATTIHVAMNIEPKHQLYQEAKRVIKPGGVFAVYDVLQGEGGEVLFPVPWAREPSISHLATPAEMETFLHAAGFSIMEVTDSTDESQAWFEAMAARMQASGPPKLSFQLFLGADFAEMARNQVRNLAERRIRTVSYVCKA